MIIYGDYEIINNKDVFEMRDINGARILSVERNRYMPNKLLISNPSNSSVCTGTFVHNENSDEFIMLEKETKILHIKQLTGINLPKFDIVSTFGSFNTKQVLRNKELILLDNGDVAAGFSGNLPEFKIEVDDSRDIFYTMCVMFGIVMLMQMRPLFNVISKF